MRNALLFCLHQFHYNNYTRRVLKVRIFSCVAIFPSLTGPLHVQSVPHAFLELVTDCLYTGSLFVIRLFRNFPFSRVNVCVALILKSVSNYTCTYKTIYLFNVYLINHVILNEDFYISYKTLYNIIKVKRPVG